MSVSKRLRFEILKRDGNKCRYCGATANESPLTIDHVVPVALGGSDDPSNLVAACKDCNAGKSASNPDAALVATVSEDAVRWAQAHQLAANKMLADLEARAADRRAFQCKWSSWKDESGESVELPGNWAPSVDQFMSAGLPLPVLLDCVDRAMGNSKIRRHDLFRYMCGIAWKRVRELRDTTAAVLNAGEITAPAVMREAHETVALHHLLGHLHRLDELTDPFSVYDLVREFDEIHGDDEEPDHLEWGADLKASVRLLEDQLESVHTWGQWAHYMIVDDLGLDFGEYWHKALSAWSTINTRSPNPGEIDHLALKLAIEQRIATQVKAGV